MNGDYKTIPILGVDTQLLDDQSPDGLCTELVNLKPRGRQDKPYWTVFETINALKNGSSTAFTYTHGIANIKSAFWQVRNTINPKFKTTTSTSLKRLVVLCEKAGRCAIDIIEPNDWSIVKSFDLPEDTGYEFTATRVREISVINITLNKLPYKLYYLIDDLLIEQSWPDMPAVSFSQNTETFTQSEVDAGTAYGVRLDSDKFYTVRWAFRLYDGTYVKHSAPQLVTVVEGDPLDFNVPEFTLAGTIEQLLTLDFWKAQIAGVSFFATVPKSNIFESLNDGLFYELAFIPSPSRIPPSDWPGGTDPNTVECQLPVGVWPTQPVLNIDSFTHHNIAARVIDSYNQRLLLGGVSTDFPLPKNEITITGGGGSSSVSLSTYLSQDDNTYSNLNQSYDGSGTPVETGGVYYITTISGHQEYTAVASGKIAKSAFVDSYYEVNPATQDTTPDGSTVPNLTFDAQVISGVLHLDIAYESSPSYGQEIPIPLIKMEVTVNIGPDDGNYKTITESLTFEVTLGNAGAGTALEIDNVELANTTVVEHNYFEIIELNVDSKTYYRMREFDSSGQGDTLNFPALIAYPDRRATKYSVVVWDGTDWRIALEKTLIQHPTSNYAYYYLLVADQTYTIGDGAITAEPDITENDQNSYIRNQVRASVTSQPLVFDAATSYRIGNQHNDTIQGFAINQVDISQGQFGQYPLYVLTDRSVWALEQSSDPLVAFARIVPVDTRNGLSDPKAMCNAERIVIAADLNYIYSIIGNTVERIDMPISLNSDYKSFLNGIQIAFHQEDDYEEIICSNPLFDYSWHFNLRYKVWYMSTDTFRLFFNDQSDLYGITTTEVVKYFDDKSTDVNRSWSLKTRPINFGAPYVLKRLNRGIARLTLTQENEADPEDYEQFTIKVLGIKDEHISGFPILDKYYKEETTKDPWVKTNNGSFQTFVIEMNGQHISEGSAINEFELNVVQRYANRVRR